MTAFMPVMLTPAATHSVATAQPIPGLTSLFRPQPIQPVSVPTSISVPAMSPMTALTKGTTFTPIPGTHRSSTMSTPTAPDLNQGHGTYDPSSPVVLAPTQTVIDNCSILSLPTLTNQLPITESTSSSLSEQPLPQIQLEEQLVNLPPAITPTGDPDQTGEQASGSLIEDLIPQLLPKEDMCVTSVDSVEGGREQKVGFDEAKEGQEPKRRRLDAIEEDSNDKVRVSLGAINGLVSVVRGLMGQMARNERNKENIDKALTETNCSLGKMVAALHSLKNAVEESAKEERRREERWLERERKREKELRKDQEAEQRRETRRREAEKKERGEIKSLLKKALEQKEESKGDKKEGEEKSKTSMKCALGKSYTENSMNDLSKKSKKSFLLLL